MKSYKLDVLEKDDNGDTVAEGFILLNVPSVKERVEMMKEMNLTSEDLENPIQQIIKCIPVFDKIVDKIEIKAGGQDFTELEELSYYDVFNKVFPEIATIMMNGIPLGKN